MENLLSWEALGESKGLSSSALSPPGPGEGGPIISEGEGQDQMPTEPCPREPKVPAA